jgi:hypothetical protein
MMKGCDFSHLIKPNPRPAKRNPLHDPYMLMAFKDLDKQTWHDFKIACAKNGHVPVQAVGILLRLYVEDQSFTPQPTE